MAEGEDHGGGWKIHSTGVVEGLVGAGLGPLLLPAVAAFWQRVFHTKPPEWAKGVVPNLIAAVALGLPSWLLARLTHRWRERRRHATARAKGDWISIYVADFGGGQASRTARDSVIASLRNELPRERAEVLPAGIALKLKEGVSLDDAANEAAEQARALLKRKHGDLLIWGQLLTMDLKSVVELRFVSAAQDGAEGRRFGFTEKLTLEPGFASEMGAALAAVAASLAVPAGDTGKYVAGTLMPIAGRLAPLVRAISPFHASGRSGKIAPLARNDPGDDRRTSRRFRAAGGGGWRRIARR